MEEEEEKVAAGVSFSPTLGLQAGDLVLSPLYPPPTLLPTIQLSVSITVGWLTVRINPHSSRDVLGSYQLGTGP